MDKKSYFGKEAIIPLPHQFQGGREHVFTEHFCVLGGLHPQEKGAISRSEIKPVQAMHSPGCVGHVKPKQCVGVTDHKCTTCCSQNLGHFTKAAPHWGAVGNSRELALGTAL